MAIDSFMGFKPYNADWLAAESQVDLTGIGTENKALAGDLAAGKVFEVDEYSFDIEQTLNIGSQSSGAGAGKVTFNPFSITRKIDLASPTFYQMACSGTAFERVFLALRKSSGGGVSGRFFLRFDFKLVAVKTIEWSHGDDSPTETVTFEYGALLINYAQQGASGSMPSVITKGWNRVTNVTDTTLTAPVGRNV